MNHQHQAEKQAQVLSGGEKRIVTVPVTEEVTGEDGETKTVNLLDEYGHLVFVKVLDENGEEIDMRRIEDEERRFPISIDEEKTPRQEMIEEPEEDEEDPPIVKTYLAS